jgi:hypothetical protein
MMTILEYVLLLAAMFIVGILLEQMYLKAREIHHWAKRRGCMATRVKLKDGTVKDLLP